MEPQLLHHGMGHDRSECVIVSVPGSGWNDVTQVRGGDPGICPVRVLLRARDGLGQERFQRADGSGIAVCTVFAFAHRPPDL